MSFYSDELSQLEHHFASPDNGIVILYGERQSAIQDILKSFLKNKPHFYYQARSCSAKLQQQFFYDEIREELPKGMRIDVRYSEIISGMLSVTCEKRLIVIDEFQHFFRSDASLMEELIRTVHNKWNNQKVMFLLSSSNKNWIEHDMVSTLSGQAYEIDAIIPLKPLSFDDFRAAFPSYDFPSAVEGFCIFGTFPDYWQKLDPALSLQENICKHVLSQDGFFHEKGKRLLPSELREPAVYNTILCALSSGRKKLNDLYKLTGYDRAKISVYLKNLMEYDIVEKIENYDAPGHENAQKGIYRITDAFLRFWYCFVFPHYSKLARLESDKFYKKYIDPMLRTYAGETYASVCTAFLQKQFMRSDADAHFGDFGMWFGKVGTIDLIASDKQGNHIAGFCNFEKNRMTYADLEWNRYCLKQAGLKCERLYMFSYASFDEKLKKEALSDPALILIDGEL
ncbi:MAG: ATP-binding protein [Lachnospiraceae bacterium]|nr:ATP-binding protein [Lachnospiraceae bacterium]